MTVQFCLMKLQGLSHFVWFLFCSLAFSWIGDLLLFTINTLMFTNTLMLYSACNELGGSCFLANESLTQLGKWASCGCDYNLIQGTSNLGTSVPVCPESVVVFLMQDTCLRGFGLRPEACLVQTVKQLWYGNSFHPAKLNLIWTSDLEVQGSVACYFSLEKPDPLSALFFLLNEPSFINICV